MHNLLRGAAITFSSSITGTTAASNFPVFDMRGYEGIAWIAVISGTPSTNGSTIKAQEGSSSGLSTGSDVADLEGTGVTLTSTITGGFAGIDLYRPKKRYVRLVHTKTSTADIMAAVITAQYRAIDNPVTHSTSWSHGVEYFNGPSTGTA